MDNQRWYRPVRDEISSLNLTFYKYLKPKGLFDYK
jgi:hypothetical protein